VRHPILTVVDCTLRLVTEVANSAHGDHVLVRDIIGKHVHETLADFLHECLKRLLCLLLFCCVFDEDSNFVVIALLRAVLVCFELRQLAQLAGVMAIEKVYSIKWVFFTVAPVKLEE